MNLISKIKEYLPIKEEISFKFEKNGANMLLAGATALLLLLYLYGVFGFLQHGHHAFNTSREHPWGFLVSAYEFFVALSMGTIALASSAIFFQIEAVKPLVKRMLMFGLLALIAGFSVFLFEIGHPITMIIYTALSGHPTSALFWLGVFYPLTMLFVFLTFVSFAKGNEPKLLAMFTLIFANSSILTAGSIFGLLNNNPFSSGIFYQIEFIASGLLGGIFLFSIIAKFFIKTEKFKDGVVLLKKTSIALISLLLIMYFVKYITAVYGNVPGKIEIAEHIMESPSFIIFEVGLGLLFPLLVAIFGDQEKIGRFCLASIFGLIGLMVARVNVVEAVQLVPKQLLKIKEYQLPPSIVEYSPSAVELSIGIGALGVFVLLIYIAERVLVLDRAKD
jgi:molybdopterin-containing oxidoreductase family membrane subunit